MTFRGAWMPPGNSAPLPPSRLRPPRPRCRGFRPPLTPRVTPGPATVTADAFTVTAGWVTVTGGGAVTVTAPAFTVGGGTGLAHPAVSCLGSVAAITVIISLIRFRLGFRFRRFGIISHVRPPSRIEMRRLTADGALVRRHHGRAPTFSFPASLSNFYQIIWPDFIQEHDMENYNQCSPFMRIVELDQLMPEMMCQNSSAS